MPELFKYSYRVLKLDLTLGLTDFEIPMDAQKVVYVSPTDGPELSVRLQSKSNDGIPLRPNGEIVAPFQRLYVTAAALVKIVYLMVGSPDSIQVSGRDVAISGQINSFDYFQALAKQGKAFNGYHQQTSDATNFWHFQLWNPVGSGKTLWLKNWQWRNNTATISEAVNQLTLYLHNAALGSTSGPTVRNQLVGGAAPSAEVRTLFAAFVSPTPGIALVLVQSAVLTNVETPRGFELMIPEGFGVHGLWAPNAGIVGKQSFQWAEI